MRTRLRSVDLASLDRVWSRVEVLLGNHRNLAHMRDLRPNQNPVSIVRIPVARGDIANLKNILSRAFKAVCGFGLRSLEVNLSDSIVVVHRQAALNVREHFVVLAVYDSDSWIEVRRLRLRSFYFKGQLLAGLHFELETVQVPRTRNRSLNDRWNRDAFRLGGPIVGFLFQNCYGMIRRLHLRRLWRGDNANKTRLARRKLSGRSFRSFD